METQLHLTGQQFKTHQYYTQEKTIFMPVQIRIFIEPTSIQAISLIWTFRSQFNRQLLTSSPPSDQSHRAENPLPLPQLTKHFQQKLDDIYLPLPTSTTEPMGQGQHGPEANRPDISKENSLSHDHIMK